MIGPHWEYDKNVRSLAQLIANEAGLEVSYTYRFERVGRKTTKVKVPRVSLGKQEKEVRAAGYKAWMLSSKQKVADVPAIASRWPRQFLRSKKRIGEIQKAYADLSQDTLITSAIELIAPGGKLI